MTKPDWRRRAEKAERENVILRAELAVCRRVYGEHLNEIVSLKIVLESVKALLAEAAVEIESAVDLRV